MVRAKRGLRKDSPLSPYLFGLIFEGLSSFLKCGRANRRLHEIYNCHGVPEVSRLPFTHNNPICSQEQARMRPKLYMTPP